MTTSLTAVIDPGCIGHQCTYLFDVRVEGAPAVVDVTHGPTCIAGLTSRAWPIPPAGALAASLTPVTVADREFPLGYQAWPTPPPDLSKLDLVLMRRHIGEGLMAGPWRVAADPRWPVLELIPGWHRLAALWRELVRRARLAVEALRYGIEAD